MFLDAFIGFLQGNLIQEGFGYAGMITIFVAFFQKDDYTTKKLMLLATLFWWAHFYFQWQISGLAACIIFIIRFFASIKWDKNFQVYLLIIALTLAVGLWSYDWLFSLLPIIASINGTTAFFYLEKIYLRFSMIFGSQLWLWYHIIHGSTSWIINEIFAQTILAFTIYRMIHPMWWSHYYAQKVRDILWKRRRLDYDRFVFIHDRVSHYRQTLWHYFLLILHLDLKKSFLRKKWYLCEKYLKSQKDKLHFDAIFSRLYHKK